MPSLLRYTFFLEGLAASSRTRLSNNRSVMPLDVLGCTRATLNGSACFPFPRGTGNPLNPIRGRDRSLQLFSVNQEFPVSASHKLALITSLPSVHTSGACKGSHHVVYTAWPSVRRRCVAPFSSTGFSYLCTPCYM